MNPSIVVVGACNVDLISYAQTLPKPGETIHGKSFQIGFGGKGANQCIAAAKLGARVAMVGWVGSDRFGDDFMENFVQNSVDVQFVKQVKDVTTGVASITVDESGENSIIIVSGANNEISPVDVLEAEDSIKKSKIVICQGEINEETTKAALKLAKQHNVKTLMNAAPASKSMDEEIYALSDIFVVNEIEASALTEIEVGTLDEAFAASKILLNKGCGEVIVTLGDQGAVYAAPETKEHVVAPTVAEVLDTTGAGDSFVGTLAYLLSNRNNLTRPRMIELACKVASLSVQRKGTQSSFVTKEEFGDILSCE